MSTSDNITPNLSDSYRVLKQILEGTASHTGQQFFRSLVKTLAETLHTRGAWITEYLEGKKRLRAISFWMDDHFVDEYEYDIFGTPCEQVLQRRELFHVPENLIRLFPKDPDLKPFNAVSYLGAPILSPDGHLIGHLAVQDTRPMPEQAKNIALFKIFADRASAEMRRLKSEQQLREREHQLSRLVGSVMDAILEMDQNLNIIQANSAATKLFSDGNSVQLENQSMDRYFHSESVKKLKNLIHGIRNREKEERSLWVPGGFQVCKANGSLFQCEASLSCYEHHQNIYFYLVLRNITDRINAEKRIEILQTEKEILHREINHIHSGKEWIGGSPVMQRVLELVKRVAKTDATVLITGETGTGKELIARTLHAKSRRNHKPMITINCAAIPPALMESEFFGHEKGAFTGATESRKGRFLLADGGTLFLDEIGELPIELQPKLLRILQEGEFEPVGSSKTVQVNVRVIAATNRNLLKMVKDGTFREDLYYRLHVIPIEIPPLRDRQDDVIELARYFIGKLSRKTGRHDFRLSGSDHQALTSYSWPGNIRELQNVIERAVVTSSDGTLNLSRIIHGIPSEVVPDRTADRPSRVLSEHELRQAERINLLKALEQSKNKISGKNGAAALIGIPASTFTSRMKTHGIRIPHGNS
jgi:PAS domain S-box-containing protein